MSVRNLAFYAATLAGLAACGPSGGSSNGSCPGIDNVDFDNDSSNCGRCGNVCTGGFTCQEGRCLVGECKPGESEQCYDGQPATRNVGPCKGGVRDCDETGRWSACDGEVLPTGENLDHSHDGIDNNCNGKTDENEDADGDGLTTWDGDCCDSTECPNPAQIGLGSFDVAGNNFDDDCDGVIDNTPLLCDQGIPSNTQNAMDYAKAIDICQVATMADKKWGVISAALTLTDGGAAVPDPEGHAVRPKFGTNLAPQGGVNLAILSTGGASAKNDTNPSYHSFDSSYTHTGTNTAPFPADWLAANGGKVPNAPGCDDPLGSAANDPEMLTLEIRVPTNAKSFKLSTNFYSAEFPEFVCSAFNDFFVVLLDSTYTGTPANPADKNLAFYTPMSGAPVPVGVNLAGKGLFTQCVNGSLCGGLSSGNITSCVGTDQLAGTGFDDSDFGCGDPGATVGGATGWLVTQGNVTPGEIIKLRIAIWDTSDHIYDSVAVIDGFQWSIDTTNPGTVIFKDKPDMQPLPADAVVTSNRSASRLMPSPMPQ